MQQYVNSYPTLNKTIVYNFNLYEGGIGDNIKFFIYLLELCIQHNVKLFYLKNNLISEKYIKLVYESMYISMDKIKNPIHLHRLDFESLNENQVYFVRPHLLYPSFTYHNTIIPNKIFYFDYHIIKNSYRLLNVDKYISVHVRLGDKYLEIDKRHIQCYDDVREFDEPKLFKYIEDNSHKNIIIFSDNKQYKSKIKQLYNHVIILDTKIGHTALSHTSEEQIIDTITEFYIMSNSESIYIACNTGFSIMAAKFNNITCYNFT
jgi:hypothetical protein